MNMLETNEILYLISNLFRLYVLYRFFAIFLERTNTDKRLELTTFLAFYIVNSVTYLYYLSPLINLGINITSFFLLTFIYKGKLATRVFSTVLIYSMGMLLESIIYNLFVNQIPRNSLEILTSILTNVILFIMVLILEKIFAWKHVLVMNTVHWLAIFLIPVSSILIVVAAFLSNYNPTATIVNVALLLGINVLVFYLYDKMIEFYNDKYEKELLKQQNNAYLHQFEIIREANENIRLLRHDMKNHIFVIQNMLQKSKYEELLEYLNSTYDYIDVKTEYISTGNAEVDSILNYKFFEAKKAGASIESTVNIPEKINVKPFDLNIILGNILDNAIDAIKKSVKKELKIEIELDRTVLFISISNSYNGKVNKKNDVFLTTKKDIQNHGLGLRSVQDILEKYNGQIDFDYDEQIFEVNILLYNPKV